MNDQRLSFLTDQFIPLLSGIDPSQKPVWGKMNPQQMVEHLAEFFQVSAEGKHYDLMTPEEKLPLFREFLTSNKQFRENTKAPMLPDTPYPPKHQSYAEALSFLSGEFSNFLSFFRDNVNKETLHPVFGNLNFGQWVQLHYKHVVHHLKQFGIVV